MASSKTPAVPVLKLPSVSGNFYGGMQTTFFEKGVDAYERVRQNRPVKIEMSDGTLIDGNVQAVSVGALLDLLPAYGSQAIYTYGQPYSATSLVRAIAEIEGVEVLDVTKLYTVITVTVDATPIPIPAV